ncbi:MAG: MotA/TolQ/ExbB proton channel family protein [Desulfuromonas sp.]|nr:MAG: MotA/TolQ/ExbB proton channel family protein [Desulfuromonas sp.]
MTDLLGESLDMIRHGGLVMWPLLASSLVMWLMIFYKSLLFFQARRDEVNLNECRLALKEQRYVGAFWQQSILRQFIWLHEHQCLDRDHLLQLQQRQSNEVDRFIGTILVLASAAPLMGLLGTVSGMITTFNVISVFGTGNARAMAAGISEALITTQAGLVVAVPGLILGALLYRRAEQIKERMQRFSLRLLQQGGL